MVTSAPLSYVSPLCRQLLERGGEFRNSGLVGPIIFGKFYTNENGKLRKTWLAARFGDFEELWETKGAGDVCKQFLEIRAMLSTDNNVGTE